MNKIMLIVPFLSGGGAERVVSIWASELATLGVDTHLLLFYRVQDEYELNSNVIVHTLKMNKEQYDKLSIFEKIILLRQTLKSVNPDVIIPFISHVGLMTNISRVSLQTKIIETIRINPNYSPKNKVMRLFRNISVLFSNGCIVQNEEQKKYFPKWIQKKIYVLANPISDEFIQLERTIDNSEIHIITAVGRLECQKNYNMLINAFSKIKNSRLVLKIYGEGSLRGNLQIIINDLGLSDRVKLCGRSSDMKKVFINTDLFILSSNAEGMPNSLMEALAVGIPCISTNCPTGPSDLINSGINGVLIPVNNEDALVNAINNMIDNPKKAFLMGRQAKQDMKRNYVAKESAKKLFKFLNKI